ncbi:MAG TPA: hypothetical protein DCG39_06210 [Opitutae bacterium]|nr:hypothetical protein [Opitutae bacterium]
MASRQRVVQKRRIQEKIDGFILRRCHSIWLRSSAGSDGGGLGLSALQSWADGSRKLLLPPAFSSKARIVVCRSADIRSRGDLGHGLKYSSFSGFWRD